MICEANAAADEKREPEGERDETHELPGGRTGKISAVINFSAHRLHKGKGGGGGGGGDRVTM